MSATTPNDATKAAEEKEAHKGHDAGGEASPEESATAPTEAGEGVAAHYEEMTEKGAHVKGEGETP